MNSQLLQLVGVDKAYGAGPSSVVALRDVNLAVSAGEFVAVTGATGSGKSSLLAIAAGLSRPTNGEIFVDSKPLGGLNLNDTARVRRRSIGLVLQDANLVPMLTALENVSLPCELDGIPTETAHRQAEDALRIAGIPELADRYTHNMSGGQQQRVAMARAIVGDRQLILADEPTATLDSPTGDEELGVLRNLADAGAAVLLTTRETRQTAWADRVIFIKEGRIVGETNTGKAR